MANTAAENLTSMTVRAGMAALAPATAEATTAPAPEPEPVDVAAEPAPEETAVKAESKDTSILANDIEYETWEIEGFGERVSHRNPQACPPATHLATPSVSTVRPAGRSPVRPAGLAGGWKHLMLPPPSLLFPPWETWAVT